MTTQRFRGLEAILSFDNWPMLVLGRLFDRKTGFVAYRKNGLDILVDHRGGDQCGTRLCIATDMYRKYLRHFRLPPQIRILDLGANGGGFPLMLKIAGFEIARAVCVELNPLTFQRLQLNLSTNLGQSAIAVNAAVCDMPPGSEVHIQPSRGGTGDSMYEDRATSAEACVSVPTTTFRALYDQYLAQETIDLCKIDIEGAEFDLLSSTSDDLLVRIRYLIVEVHYFHESGAERWETLRNRLLDLGFTDVTIPESHKTNHTTEVLAFAGPIVNEVSAPKPAAA